ncbi:hypothetical protein LSAT2_024417 [Lamellibrachia satsuma]|nr:hypothetical protein LSAT2_024417 [Lamellibrachia satsuma]
MYVWPAAGYKLVEQARLIKTVSIGWVADGKQLLQLATAANNIVDAVVFNKVAASGGSNTATTPSAIGAGTHTGPIVR